MGKEIQVSPNTSTTPVVHTNSVSLLHIVGLFALGGIMFKSGYVMGQHVADKILKRHDKDVNQIEKKTYKYVKSEMKRLKRDNR